MLEAVSMADMYIGDWQVLFANPEGAARAYLRSNRGLRMAGIEQQAINQFFSAPTVLPINHHYSSWSAAVSGESSQSLSVSLPEAEMRFNFKQWSPNFPYAQSPFTLQSGITQEANEDEFLTFSLSLAGLEEVARWHRGRYRTSVSVARDINWLSQAVSTPVDPLDMEESIRKIHFRPKLVNGIAQTVNATLHYQLAASQ